MIMQCLAVLCLTNRNALNANRILRILIVDVEKREYFETKRNPGLCPLRKNEGGEKIEDAMFA